MNVIEKSVAPTANIDCPFIDPAGASPKLTCTIKAVIV
jgi:hypothetical protein